MKVMKTSDFVAVCRCSDCVYFNDMRDLGKDCFCELHSVTDAEGDIAHFFDVEPDGYCAWGYSADNDSQNNCDCDAILGL